jgi:ribosome recycling factor
MSTTEVLTRCDERMGKAMNNLTREFQSIRTGRANPALLDRVEVEYYGTPTPLKSLANISTADGRSLVVSPYDKTCLKDIEQAIHKSGLGLTPTSDGSIVRISIPTLTEERRRDLTKLVKKFAEETRVAIRNVRRDGAEEIKKLKGTGISDDDVRRQEEALQKLTDKFIKDVDKLTHDKEAEVMEV